MNPTQSTNVDQQPRLLTPAEMAHLFRVDPKTISRWAKQDRYLPGTVVRTLGGHRRYREDLIMQLLEPQR